MVIYEAALPSMRSDWSAWRDAYTSASAGLRQQLLVHTYYLSIMLFSIHSTLCKQQSSELVEDKQPSKLTKHPSGLATKHLSELELGLTFKTRKGRIQRRLTL